MVIKTLNLQNFRCFESAQFNFSEKLTIIQGNNGSGKTSLLEAIHYSCYVKSFRTHLPLELSHDAKESPDINLTKSFTIKITTHNDDSVLIGVSEKKRAFKINGVDVKNYKNLIDSYKVVTFIEEDLALIKGYPEQRRAFVDQAIYVQDPHYYSDLRQAKKNIDQRNRMLYHKEGTREEYRVWFDEFIKINSRIISRRKKYLQELLHFFSLVCSEYGTEPFLNLSYKQKRYNEDHRDITEIINDEVNVGRVLYGFHLDDIEFTLYKRDSRAFASRGQQKLAILLLKIAQSRLLMNNVSSQKRLVFLLDDFLTDFDTIRIEKIASLLFFLDIQVIITIPQENTFLFRLCEQRLKKDAIAHILLDTL